MKVERVNMSRDEWKEFLKENKVDERFLQMPGVIERLRKYVNVSPSFNMEIDNGNFHIEYYNDGDKNLYFSIDDDGIVKVNDCITLNQYGIDVEYEDGDWIGWYSREKRKEGIIFLNGGNNGTCYSYERFFIDNGNWELKNAFGEKLDFKGKELEIEEDDDEDIDIDKVLDIFDENSEPIIKLYPKTTEWFEQQRNSLQDKLEKYNDPKNKIKRIENRSYTRIHQLKREIRNLKKQNKSLKDENEGLKELLKKVKDNFFGNIIIGLKDENEELKELLKKVKEIFCTDISISLKDKKTKKKSQHGDLDQK